MAAQSSGTNTAYYRSTGAVDQNGMNRIAYVRIDAVDVLDMVLKGTLNARAEHELGHALGLGLSQRWFAQIGVKGDYTGTYGVDANRLIGGFGQNGEVPLDSSQGHWNEAKYKSELMTPDSRDLPYQPMSRLSVFALKDRKFDSRYGRELTRA
jgi:hypothetical protein